MRRHICLGHQGKHGRRRPTPERKTWANEKTIPPAPALNEEGRRARRAFAAMLFPATIRRLAGLRADGRPTPRVYDASKPLSLNVSQIARGQILASWAGPGRLPQNGCVTGVVWLHRQVTEFQSIGRFSGHLSHAPTGFVAWFAVRICCLTAVIGPTVSSAPM